jgi:hypothetical protein
MHPKVKCIFQHPLSRRKAMHNQTSRKTCEPTCLTSSRTFSSPRRKTSTSSPTTKQWRGRNSLRRSSSTSIAKRFWPSPSRWLMTMTLKKAWSNRTVRMLRRVKKLLSLPSSRSLIRTKRLRPKRVKRAKHLKPSAVMRSTMTTKMI